MSLCFRILPFVLITLFGASSCFRYPADLKVPPLPRTARQKEKAEPGGRTHGKLLVALAFSGGGSRAAYMAEQVIEHLGRFPIDLNGQRFLLLDEVDYISSVSGGSLAAAYHAAWYPSGRKDLAAYFKRFKAQMSRNIQGEALLSMFSLSWLRRLIFSDTRRTDLLAEYFHYKILGRASFGQLGRHARAGLAPRVILNAIIYSSRRFGHGGKFLFTNLKSSGFDSPAVSAYKDADLAQTIRVVTPDDLGIDLERFPVSRGVAASAAFPFLLTPLRVRDHRIKKNKAVLLGDGGIYDNLGLETMTQRLHHVLAREPYKGALLIVVNAEQPYEFKEGINLVAVLHQLAAIRARTLSRIMFKYMGSRAPHGRPIQLVELKLMEGAGMKAQAKKLAKVPTAFFIRKPDQRLVERSVSNLFVRHEKKISSTVVHLLRKDPAAAQSPVPVPPSLPKALHSGGSPVKPPPENPAPKALPAGARGAPCAP